MGSNKSLKVNLEQYEKLCQGNFLSDEEIDAIREEERNRRDMAKKMGAISRFLETVPPRFKDSTFDTFEIVTDKQAKAVEWLKSGGSAVIYGPNGVGKTHLAYAACLYQATLGKSVCYVLAFDLFTRIKSTFVKGNTDSLVNEFAGYDYLVIDEVDKTYASETDFVYFFSIINQRYNYMRKTVLIANSANLSEISGKSSFDRVASDGIIINLDGANYRHRR